GFDFASDLGGKEHDAAIGKGEHEALAGLRADGFGVRVFESDGYGSVGWELHDFAGSSGIGCGGCHDWNYLRPGKAGFAHRELVREGECGLCDMRLYRDLRPSAVRGVAEVVHQPRA